MKKFSIILPVRNGGEYLKECVKTILSQSYEGFDLHILNNNSTDGTTEWLKTITDKRVFVSEANKDLSMPQNWARALNLPLNTYITFIGHDDRLHIDYLQEMGHLIDRHPDASLYQTHFNYINASGEFIRSCQPMPDKIAVDSFLKYQFLGLLDNMGTGYLFKASDFKKLGGFPVQYPNLIFGDYELFVRLIGLSYLAVSKKCCFEYRLHQSLSRSTNVNQYRIAFDKYLHFINGYQTENKDVRKVVQQYGKTYLNFYCQSLSHRLLKSDVKGRMHVAEFIAECIKNAEALGIKGFFPNRVFKIWISGFLDKWNFSRNLFNLLRKK